MSHSTATVLSRIDQTIAKILSDLTDTTDTKPNTDKNTDTCNHNKPPTLSSPFNKSYKPKSFANLSQCRSLTNSILVLSFVQKLLRSNRTTTNRELYYIFITHFRSQRECDAAIVDVCNLLGLERISLGLTASPKGWFCGNIRIIRRSNDINVHNNDEIIQTMSSTDGTSLSSIQGLPITREWIHRAAHIIPHPRVSSHQDREVDVMDSDDVLGDNHEEDGDSSIMDSNDHIRDDEEDSAGLRHREHLQQHPYQHMHHEAQFEIQSDARCIVVVEKEGVYTRLSEDRFFDRIPCILVTGKGFPDIATRALVFVLHHTLRIPVYGLADCNPYGLAVLQTYFRGGQKNEMDGGDRYHVPIQWIGLRPSQLHGARENADPTFRRLPREVYQKLTELDLKKMDSLCAETNQFMFANEARLAEVEIMRANGWKVELESLHWLGIDFMSDWLEKILWVNEDARAARELLHSNRKDNKSTQGGDDMTSLSEDGSFEIDPRIAI